MIKIKEMEEKMRKNFRISILAMLVLCMTAGLAFAGSTRVNYGSAPATNAVISLETLGIARNIIIYGGGATINNVATAANLPALVFKLGANLSTSNLLQLTLSGGAQFTGDPINFCAINGVTGTAVQVAAGSPLSGDTVLTTSVSQVTANTLSGDYLWATYNACATNNGDFPLKLAAGTAGTSAKANITMQSSGGVILDNSTAVTVATVIREFNVVNASTSHTIDFLAAGATGNLLISGGTTQITADSQLATPGVNVIGFTHEATATNNVAANTNTATAISGNIILTDSSQSWAGVNRVWLVPAGNTCLNGTLVAGTNSPSGTIALSMPAANFSATVYPLLLNLCVQGNGQSLGTRTIQAEANVKATISGTDYATGITGSLSSAQVWGINGYQAYIPWSQAADAAATICLINNANTSGSSASVLIEAVSGEGGTTIASTNIGSVALKTSKVLLLNGSNACLSSDASTCDNGQSPLSLTTLATKRYAVKLTVTGSPANVTVTCVQKDAGTSTGMKRVMPVLTDSSSNSYFRQ